MRCVAVHTVPVWQEPDGSTRYGLTEERDHPPVVGWANLVQVELDSGEQVYLLAVDVKP